MKKKSKIYSSLRWLGRITIVVLFSVAAIGSIVFLSYLRDLPQPESFAESQFNQPTKIYDATGKVLLYTIVGEENRTVVPYEQISPYLRQAVLAAEDSQFYQHNGLDIRGLARAILVDLKLKKPLEGGSTITQQLIRSYFLNNKKTLKRKTEELVLTLELEKKYDKKQILTWYLNQIPFGSNFYGVEVASQQYFQKHAQEVSLPEAATLAALIKAPTYLSPYGSHLPQLLDRRNYILGRMEKLGYIKHAQMIAAQKAKPHFQNIRSTLKAPHFTLHVVKELEDLYGKHYLQRNGLKVYTTLNWPIQQQAEQIVQEGVKRNRIYQVYNGALVAIDPQTGKILALVGSKDYFAPASYPPHCSTSQNQCLFSPKFDVVHLGARHPGSSLKPFIYATAFEKGISPQHIIMDEKTDFGNWGGKDYIPNNYDGRFRGPVTLEQALAESLNVPSVKVFMYLAGIQDSLKTLKAAGISSPLPAVPSLVLGAGDVNLLELTGAYGVFATGGYKIHPFDILKVEDNRGNTVFQAQNQKEKREVINPRVAQTITHILSSEDDRAPMFGYHSNLYIPGYRVAVKTGTNDNFQDFWTVGYTSYLITGVWLGNNNQAPMAKVPSVTTAGWVWNKFMAEVLPEVTP